METITNAANAASKAIWGESNTTDTQTNEPVSGQTGDVKSGEPYDAGNLDSTNTQSTNPTSTSTDTSGTSNTASGGYGNTNTSSTSSDNFSSSNTTSGDNANTSTNPTSTSTESHGASNTASGDYASSNTNTTSGSSDNYGNSKNTLGDSGSSDTKLGTTGSADPTSSSTGNVQSDTNPVNTRGPIRSEHEHDKTGVTSLNSKSNAFGDDKPSNANDDSGAGAAPSVGADPSSAPQQTQKQQGADRPHEEPTGDEQKAVKDSKEKAEEGQNIDTSGPGPKPLEQKGKADGAAGGDDDGPQKESHGEGTGEKYIKTSGVKADGGDFDAAQAGAGREADRLLEEKGIHRETPGQGPPAGKDAVGGGDDASGSSKPSMGERIKAKLHKS